MIDFCKALQIANSTAKTLGTEEIDFREVNGRILAEDIFSDMNMPPFDKSAMDGYACRREDLENELEVIELIPAGIVPKKEVGKNQCSKIMTGAMVPKGADTVIIVENVEETDSHHIRYNQQKTSSNICYLGEDIKLGERIIEKDCLLRSRHIPSLASIGKTMVRVYKMPRIGMIATGSEIVEPWDKLSDSQIRNSNTYAILALAKDMALDIKNFGICPDDVEIAQPFFEKAVQECDILIFSGAVSMGDFDFVPELLLKNKVKIHFHGLNVKPGKRIIFGTGTDDKWFFGLPGNPVSAFMQFEFLIKPFLYRMMGIDKDSRFLKFQMLTEFRRKKDNKDEFIPVKINKESKVEIIPYNGSAHINVLVEADAILFIPKGVKEILPNEVVNVYLMS